MQRASDTQRPSLSASHFPPLGVSRGVVCVCVCVGGGSEEGMSDTSYATLPSSSGGGLIILHNQVRASGVVSSATDQADLTSQR
jgi:hypothetical protein